MKVSRRSGASMPERAFHVVDQIVDDRVVADLHAFFFGQVAGLLVGADVEREDRRPEAWASRTSLSDTPPAA
jgi:hypothetical protein